MPGAEEKYLMARPEKKKSFPLVKLPYVLLASTGFELTLRSCISQMRWYNTPYLHKKSMDESTNVRGAAECMLVAGAQLYFRPFPPSFRLMMIISCRRDGVLFIQARGENLVFKPSESPWPNCWAELLQEYYQLGRISSPSLVCWSKMKCARLARAKRGEQGEAKGQSAFRMQTRTYSTDGVQYLGVTQHPPAAKLLAGQHAQQC